MANIYVSSTFSDLKSHREQVRTALRRLGQIDVAMEYYGASDERPLGKCLDDVAACDLYLGIFAWCYGFIPEGHEKSITELEFRKAVETGKSCLIFLVNESAPWPPLQVDRGKSWDMLVALKDEFKKNYMLDFFSNESELVAKVSQAIGQWDKKLGLIKKGPITDWDDYRKAVAEKHKWVRLQVIAGATQEKITRIPLTDVFVPQLAQTGRPTFEVPDNVLQARRGLFSSEKIPDAEAISDDESNNEKEDPEILPVAFPEPVAEILGRERWQVVLGGPGSGKSTLLHYTMLMLCDLKNAAGTQLPQLENSPIPFLIELRQYVLSKVPDFVDYIVQSANERYGAEVVAEDVKSILREDDKALVFFDGLDEVFDSAERSRVTEMFGAFARRYPKARIVVTSRIVGYDSSDLKTEGFQHYTLLDFDVQQVRQFVSAWYQYYTWEGDQRDASGLIQRIAENPRLMELAGNPLLLTMMAIIYKQRDLPERRWELYKLCTDVLLEDWDMKRKRIAHAELPDIRITRDQKIAILQRVSVYMLEHGQEGRELNAIAYQPVMDILTAYLEDEFEKSPGDAKSTAEAILNHLRERTYILAEVGERIFGFVHRTFMEYFAARNRMEVLNGKPEDYQKSIRETFSKWEQSEWQEVLFLLVGMLAGQGSPISAIVEFLRVPIKGAIPHNIAFVARCLAEAGSIKDKALTQDVMTELVKAISHYVKPRKDVQGDRRDEVTLFVDIALTNFSLLAAIVEVPAEAREIIAKLDKSTKRNARVAAWRMNLALRSEEERLDFALSALVDREEAVRLGAVAALRRGWAGKEEVALALINVIRGDKNSRVREAAIQAMKFGWPNREGVLDALEARAADESAFSFVISVINYVGSNWQGSFRGLQLILALAGRKRKASAAYDYSAVRRAAATSISKGWRKDNKTLTLLTDLANDDRDQELSAMAVDAISQGWIDDAKTLGLIREVAVSGRDPLIRTVSIQALVKTYAAHFETLPLLQDLARHDSNVEVVIAVLNALAVGWHEHPDTLPLLCGLVNDHPGSDIRVGALRVIARHWRKSPDVLGLLRNWTGSQFEPEVRINALRSITSLQLPEGFEDLAFNFGVHPWIYGFMRSVMYGRDVDSDPDTFSLFLDLARNEEDSDVRVAAIRGLLMWRTKEETQTLLQEIAAHDLDASVHDAAESVLNPSSNGGIFWPIPDTNAETEPNDGT